MRRALLAIGIGIGAVVLAVSTVDLLMFQDEEVAILVTHGAEGDEFETPLWVVESVSSEAAPGTLWVRAHSAEVHWLERLSGAPEVELSRDGQVGVFVAEIVADDPALRARVNAAMEEKYGLADRLACWLADPAQSVPIRLRPAAAPGVGDS